MCQYADLFTKLPDIQKLHKYAKTVLKHCDTVSAAIFVMETISSCEAKMN